MALIIKKQCSNHFKEKSKAIICYHYRTSCKTSLSLPHLFIYINQLSKTVEEPQNNFNLVFMWFCLCWTALF